MPAVTALLLSDSSEKGPCYAILPGDSVTRFSSAILAYDFCARFSLILKRDSAARFLPVILAQDYGARFWCAILSSWPTPRQTSATRRVCRQSLILAPTPTPVASGAALSPGDA